MSTRLRVGRHLLLGGWIVVVLACLGAGVGRFSAEVSILVFPLAAALGTLPGLSSLATAPEVRDLQVDGGIDVLWWAAAVVVLLFALLSGSLALRGGEGGWLISERMLGLLFFGIAVAWGIGLLAWRTLRRLAERVQVPGARRLLGGAGLSYAAGFLLVGASGPDVAIDWMLLRGGSWVLGVLGPGLAVSWVLYQLNDRLADLGSEAVTFEPVGAAAQP